MRQSSVFHAIGLQHGGCNKDLKKVDFLEDGALRKCPVDIFSERASLPHGPLTQAEIIQQAAHLIEIVPVVEGDYDYKYQGQERQDELGLNWESFKWRNYDYAIGRFMSVDPLAEKYNYQSPYNFAENRVVDGVELEGLEWVDANGNQKYDPSIENADGTKGSYTQYATDQDKAFGNGLRNSGITSASKFNQLVTSEYPTTVVFSDAVNGLAGITNPVLDKNGELVGFEIIIYTKTSERIIENHDPMKDGVHSVDANLIDEGNITPFEYSISTFGHEIDHANKDNHDKIQTEEKTGVINKEDNSETVPTNTGRKILEEIGENKK